MPLPQPYFQHENCTIYHGDSHEILKLIHAPDDRVVVATDPPYNLALKSAGGAHVKLEQYADLMNAARSFQGIMTESARLCRPDGCIWWMTHLPSGIAGVVRAMDLGGISPLDMLVWKKPPGHPAYGINREHEHAIFGVVDIGAFSQANQGKSIRGIAEYRRASQTDHPAEKPVGLFKTMIHWTVKAKKPASLVIDPFMGSGTTLVAAKALGIRCIGIEQSEKWCSVAVKRLRAQRQNELLPSL